MSKFSSYTVAQLNWACNDIATTISIWSGDSDNPYLREKELELDELRDELTKRQVQAVSVQRDKLMDQGFDGMVASLMANWMVKEGISVERAAKRADLVYWGE